MSKKYFVEGKGYIEITPEEEPIFLRAYKTAVEVKPKGVIQTQSVNPLTSDYTAPMTKLKEMVTSRGYTEATADKYVRARMTQKGVAGDVGWQEKMLGLGLDTADVERYEDASNREIRNINSLVSKRNKAEQEYGNLARDLGEVSPQAKAAWSNVKALDEMLNPKNIKTPEARNYLIKALRDENAAIWSTRLQNLAKTQAELASQKDASPDWNKRYNAINKEIAHANELYRYYASGMTDAEAGLVRAGEQISNSFGNTWTGIVPRAFISFGSGAVDMLYSPMALGGVLAGGQGGLANQRFVSQGLSTETGNILSDLLQQTAYSAPMTIATMANPALGAALTFSNIIEANMNDVAVKYGGWDKAPKGTQTAAITSGIISGAIEYGSNLIQIGVVRKLSAARTPASFANAKNFIKSTITGKGRALSFAKAMGIDGVVEGTEEYVDSMSSDLLNNALGETNYTMAEMVAHANKAFIGGAFGGLTFGLFGGGYHSFQARSQWKTTEALAKANNPTAKTVMQMVTELKKDSPDVQAVNAKAEQLMQAKSEGIKNKKLEMAVANILDSVYANGLYASSYEEMQRQFPDNEQINSFDVVMLKQGIYEVYQELNKLTSGKPNQKNQTKERIATTLKAIAQEISFGHNDRALQLLSQMRVQNLGNIQSDPEMAGFYQSASKIIGKLTRYATQGKQASDAYASLRGNQITQQRVETASAPEIAPQKAETQPWEQPKQEAPLETSVIFAEAYRIDKNQKAKPEQIAETLTRIDQVMQSDAPDTMKKVLGEIRDRLTARLAEPTETKEEKPTKETKEVKPVKPVEPVTAGQTKVIHIKKNQLELSDEAYRAEVKAVSKGRTETSKELTYTEAQALINRLNKMEKPKKQAPKKAEPKPESPKPEPKKETPKPTLERVEWRSVTDMVSGKTISNWENFETSETSNRKIVHVFWIKDESGKTLPYGKISAAKKLGISLAQADKAMDKAKAKWKSKQDSIKRWRQEASKIMGEDSLTEAQQSWRGFPDIPHNEDFWANVDKDYVVAEKDSKVVILSKKQAERIDAYQSEGWKIISILERRDSERNPTPAPVQTEEQKPDVVEEKARAEVKPETKVEEASETVKEKAGNLSLAEYTEQYVSSNKYKGQYEKIGKLSILEKQAKEQWVKDLKKQAETERLSDKAIESYISEYGMGSLQSVFRGTYARGINGWIPNDLRPVEESRKEKLQKEIRGLEQRLLELDNRGSSPEKTKIRARIKAIATSLLKIYDKENPEPKTESPKPDVVEKAEKTNNEYKNATYTEQIYWDKINNRSSIDYTEEQRKAIREIETDSMDGYAKVDTQIIGNRRTLLGFPPSVNRDNPKEVLAFLWEHRKGIDYVIPDENNVQVMMGLREAIASAERRVANELYPKPKPETLPIDKAETKAEEIPSIEIYSPSARMNGGDKLRAEKIARLNKLETLKSEGATKVKVGSAVMSIETAIKKTEATLDDKTLSEYRKPNAETKPEQTPITDRKSFQKRYREAQPSLSTEQIDAQLQAYDALFETYSKAMGISLDDAYKTFQISNLDPKENSLSQAERADIAEAERQMEAVRKQYQGTDQWMKAPNGKPTKLNERQWLQVRTPNFLNWFGTWDLGQVKTGFENVSNQLLGFSEKNKSLAKGFYDQKYSFILDVEISTDNGKTWIPDSIKGLNKKQAIERARRNWDGNLIREANASKVVDENGEPMVVWHSTDVNFNEFDITKARSYSGEMNYDLPGFYFTGREEFADDYGSRTVSAFLNIKNPFTGADLWQYKRDNGLDSWREVYDKLIADGYDGAIMDEGVNNAEEEFISFSPTQIKSATANVGTFDPENADIRYQKVLGYLTTKPDGNMIIGFLSPDFSTGLHEQAHIGEVFLKSMAKTDPKWKQVLGWAEEWLGVEKGKWTVEQSEKFAQGYEKYLLEGKAPNSKMQAVFNQIKAWMNAIANKVKELAGIELTDQMRQVYSALLGGEYQEKRKGVTSPVEDKYGFTGKEAVKRGLIIPETVTSRYGKERIVGYSARNGSTVYDTMLEALDAYYSNTAAEAEYRRTRKKDYENWRESELIDEMIYRKMKAKSENDGTEEYIQALREDDEKRASSAASTQPKPSTKKNPERLRFKDIAILSVPTTGVLQYLPEYERRVIDNFKGEIFKAKFIFDSLIKETDEENMAGSKNALSLRLSPEIKDVKDRVLPRLKDKLKAMQSSARLSAFDAEYHAEDRATLEKVITTLESDIDNIEGYIYSEIRRSRQEYEDRMRAFEEASPDTKPQLTKAQKMKATELKENLKLKESTSVNEFAHKMEVLIGKFNNLTLSQPRAGKFSVLNVDLGKVILEVTSKDGFEINGTAYTNVYDALVAVTDLLGENTASNSVTRFQVAETTNDKEEMEKLAKRKANSEKIIRNQYQKVAEAIENYGIKTENGQPIGLPAWRNALISAVDTILHEQIGVSKLTADKLKRISEQTVKPETVKRWLEDERRYREVMQMYSGYDNSSKIPTIQLFTMMAQLSPHYYKSMTANTTIENFINLYNNVKDEIEGDPEQFLEGLLYLTMTQGNIFSNPVTGTIANFSQPVKVLISMYGTAGKRLYGHVQEGTLTRARIQEKAAPSQKIIMRTLLTSDNDAKRVYLPSERNEIGRILVSVASNEDLTAEEKPEAMLAFVDSYNMKNSENPISEKDVLNVYYAVVDIVNMVQGEIEKLNSNMGEWVIGIRESYFPRTLISINKMFDSPLNEEEVQIGKPSYAEPRELDQPDLSKLSVDLTKGIDDYVSKMSRYIAFYPVKEYYTKRFGKDIPSNLRLHEGKSGMDYARNYINNAMGQYQVRGALDDLISIARTNMYASTLAVNVTLTLQNAIQKFLIAVVVPPRVYRAVMRDTQFFTGKPLNRGEMPKLMLLLDVLNNANPNQMHEYRRETQDIAKNDKASLIRLYAKITQATSEPALRKSPFGYLEKGNWGYGYIAGVYTVCMKSKPYQEARANGSTHREAIEIALSNPMVMQAAMMAAGDVNASVNADPSLVYSPKLYADYLGRQLYYVKYFHNLLILAKNSIFFKGITSKWSKELFNQTLYSTNGEDMIADQIRSLNTMIKDLDPKRIAKMERETHDLREANLPLSDMVKMHRALINLRDELVTGMRKQERLLKSGRAIQRDMLSGLLGFMIAEYLVQMIMRFTKGKTHKYFAEQHYLGDRKTARIMREEDFQPLKDAFNETQIPRLARGFGVWEGLALDIDVNQGWKGVKKQGLSWGTNLMPVVNILNRTSLEILGDTGTNIMIDKISEQ